MTIRASCAQLCSKTVLVALDRNNKSRPYSILVFSQTEVAGDVISSVFMAQSVVDKAVKYWLITAAEQSRREGLHYFDIFRRRSI